MKNYRDRKAVLVTGGAGFIGSNLCEFLLNKGNTVFCLDNLVTGSYENIHKLKEKINDSRDLTILSKEIQLLEKEITLFHTDVVKKIFKKEKNYYC